MHAVVSHSSHCGLDFSDSCESCRRRLWPEYYCRPRNPLQGANEGPPVKPPAPISEATLARLAEAMRTHARLFSFLATASPSQASASPSHDNGVPLRFLERLAAAIVENSELFAPVVAFLLAEEKRLSKQAKRNQATNPPAAASSSSSSASAASSTKKGN